MAGKDTTSDEESAVPLGEIQVSFDDDSDPMSPRSLPVLRKWIIVLLVSSGSLCVTCTSSIYTTTYDQMGAELGISHFASTFGLSTFVFGFAAGGFLAGPFSEWYGRRPIYTISWAWFILWTVPPVALNNIYGICVVRFLAGCGGGTFLAVAGGTAGDVFSRSDIVAPMAVVSSAPFVGPCIGPLLGGFICTYGDWRWTYYAMAIWGAVLLCCTILLVPETYHPVCLRRKADLLRKQTGDDRYTGPKAFGSESKVKALAVSLSRPPQMLFLEPMCLSLDVYSGLLLGILYSFFSSFPLVFGNVYNMSQWQSGLTFLGMIAGITAAASTISFLPRLVGMEAATEVSEPETRLTPAIPGAVFMPLGLLLFSWTIYPSVHWIVPIIGSAIFGYGMLLAFIGIFTFLVNTYPKYAASSLAANGLARCCFSAGFPLFSVRMYTNLGYHWATCLLAFLLVAMMPIPWVLCKYGKQLRQNSRFATKD